MHHYAENARGNVIWQRVFLQLDTGEIEISGHIDLAQRMKSENIMPYLNGEKRLLPRRGDLTYYNWSVSDKVKVT